MPEPDARHDLRHLIEILDRHGVEYLLVGGAAATSYGAERPTYDESAATWTASPMPQR